MKDEQQTGKDEFQKIINDCGILTGISRMTPAQLIADVLDAGKSQSHFGMLEVAFLNGMLCALKMTETDK